MAKKPFLTEEGDAINLSTGVSVVFAVQPKNAGRRLDAYLRSRWTLFSRSFFSGRIKAGAVTVNGGKSKPSYKVVAGDEIEFFFPEVVEKEIPATDIPLDIIFEDDYIAAINKSAGIVVHPAGGHWDDTLVNALLFYFKNLSTIHEDKERPGILHRLDKETTGVLLVAKENEAHSHLAKQFRDRTVEKEYRTIVDGVVEFDEDWITKPIDKDPKYFDRYTHVKEGGKSARTFYRVLERFDGFTYLSVRIETGRTHQIRVHLRSIGHSIAADPQYGIRTKIFETDLSGLPRREGEEPLISRSILHAHSLSFKHPVSGEETTITAPLPEDMENLLAALKKYKPLR